ncbi:hypothetical protein BMS3Bbin15_01361 [archaeon BMS3Bbin15]|nr:hypothetical protein BMS3Bbin15_01361 [archaeon BMS3Bbin15]
MKLFFYTNNRFKFRVADEIFSRYEIGLFIVKPDFKEIQAEKSEDKVVDALNNAILRPALAEDSGLYIPLKPVQNKIRLYFAIFNFLFCCNSCEHKSSLHSHCLSEGNISLKSVSY